MHKFYGWKKDENFSQDTHIAVDFALLKINQVIL
tara:strand:+ start:216 stop:317 length:102 start_codon:yes stop_codon:yes gene_type:complete